MTVDVPGGPVAVPARNRVRAPAGRSYSVNVRLTAEELRDVAAAAARAGLTPTGYTGEVTVAAARAGVETAGTAASRAELARVQRDLFAARTALVCAADALGAAQGRPAGYDVAACAAAVARLDAVADRLHGLLRRVEA
ncbi:hypothetical protein [Salinispora oceanensis]|uniref:hypothetical protein n=1 Tax=Salinispora oceanensis TaxID=1050199 RepID=UPI0004BBE47C|nr:hypothetical protein [Salinispora oceanensis]